MIAVNDYSPIGKEQKKLYVFRQLMQSIDKAFAINRNLFIVLAPFCINITKTLFSRKDYTLT